MTGDDILDLMVAQLARRAGGSARRWLLAIGPIRVYDATTHPHCNWSVSPSGNSRDIAAIEHLLDDLRLTHPLVTSR